jgi:DNA ligase-1
MGSPAKRRKLSESSKSSPAASRSLDFFFGKQNVPSRPVNGDQNTEILGEQSKLTDEELARKLQAEWNQEAAGEAKEAPASGAGDNFVETKTVNGGGNRDINGNRVVANDFEEAASFVRTDTLPVQTKGKNTLSLQSTASEEDSITSSIPFDESPLSFHPSQYVSELESHWAAEGGSASYSLLTRCFVLVNGTQSRIKIVDTLVNLLRVIIEGDPTSLLPTVRTTCYFNQIFICAVQIFGSTRDLLRCPSIQLLYRLCHFSVFFIQPLAG